MFLVPLRILQPTLRPSPESSISELIVFEYKQLPNKYRIWIIPMF